MPTAVSDKNMIKLPRIKRMMLALPIDKSRDFALQLTSAYVAMKGSMTVNSAMFTPARSDMRNPA